MPGGRREGEGRLPGEAGEVQGGGAHLSCAGPQPDTAQVGIL